MKSPYVYLTVLGAPDTLQAAPTQGLEILFLMHPIATGLIFAVMIITYFINSRDMTIAAFILSLLGGGAATFAFAADIAFVVVAKQKVNELTPGEFKILWGNAVWIVSPSGHRCWRHFMSDDMYLPAICWLGTGVVCYHYYFCK
jgi:hypothetical protein